MSYCVYYHENKINHKRYVGITCTTEACARPVVCVETGVEYATIKETAQAIGVSDKNAQRAINKGYRWGGFHWQYIDDIS